MVDDQPARLLTYESILSDLGAHCVRALSGEQALEALLREQFSVILLDVSMPGMDGFELAKLIRQHPRIERTPIIFITGVHISALDQLRGYEIGAIDYISVPVIPEILRSKVAMLLELHQRRAELSNLNAALAQARQQLQGEHESAIARRDAQLRAIFDHPDQIAVIFAVERDTAGKCRDLVYRDVNSHAQRALGRAPESLLGRRLSEVLPHRAAQVLAVCAQVLDSGEPARYETRLGERDLRVTVYPIDADLLAASATDITDQKRAEALLRGRAERFQEITEAIPQLVWSARADGCFDYYNQRFLDYLGIPLQTLQGLAWAQTLHPDDRAMALDAWAHACATGGQYVAEFRIRRGSDGEYRWHVVRGEPLRDARGQILRWFGSCTDVHELKRTEQALAESERRYRILLEHAPVGVVHCSISGRIEYANQAFCALLGYSHEQLHGRSWQEITHPDDVLLDQEFARRVLAHELPHYTLRKRYLRRDGSPVWADMFGTFVFDEQRRAVIGLAVVIDVNEGRAAEEALKESRERLMLAQKAAQLGIFDWDIRSDSLLWDERVHELWGIEPAGPLKVANFFSQLHPDDHARVRAAIDRSFNPEGDHSYSALFRVINRRDGQTRWVECLGRVYFDGQDPVRMVGMSREVTHWVHTQQQLAASEQRLRELANHIDQIVWSSDVLGSVTWYNQRWYDYTGAPVGDLRDEVWKEALDPADLERVTNTLRASLAAGEPWEETFRLRNKHGEYRWFLSRAVPICDESGRVLRWFGTSTDITAQHTLQVALEQADRRKDEFLAMLAHELRNPVAPISNAAEALTRLLSDNPPARAFADMIRRQSAHLSRLLDDLLDVARITQGRITLKRESVTVSSCLEPAMEAAQALIDQKALRVVVAHASGPLTVNADSVRLAQCFANVLINAAKFTPERGEIRISSAQEAGDALVEFADNGNGIDPEFLPHIFEPFAQSERSLDRSEGGLGIGLAVCRRLIEMQDGSITVLSAGIGRGTTVRIRLPLAAPTGSQQTADAPSATDRTRILVVDDNRDAAESLAMLLELDGHDTRTAHSGREALAVLASFAPRIVLLDIGLPEMDGYETARRIKALSPQVRLIAVSGYGQAADRQRSAAAGFDLHLVKPVEMSLLNEALQSTAT